MTTDKQEPVVYACVIETADFEQDTVTLKMMDSNYSVGAGLHWLSNTTPQPKREPLTDEQIERLFPESQSDDGLAAYWLTFARSIEAAHGIKGEA